MTQPAPGFQPEPQFAIAALQEEVTELTNRLVYTRAVLRQAQTEAITQAEVYTTEIGRLTGEISLLKSEPRSADVDTQE